MEELLPVKTTGALSFDALTSTFKDVKNGLASVKSAIKQETFPVTTDRKSKSMRTFAFDAESQLDGLSSRYTDVKVQFSNLLKYFGEDSSMTIDKFFTTLNQFIFLYENVLEELRKKEETEVSFWATLLYCNSTTTLCFTVEANNKYSQNQPLLCVLS